ncbi:hypothetical protein EDB83DRAFT_2350991 [Lactarius deliciosus]|nr:hypothetical protein EDB83DRAFT_2350991 [Lactarius deliciosus]
MYLPPPTPTNLKLARTLSLSGPATQKVDGVSFPDMPAPVSHVPEPQQATLALGPSLPLISPLGRLTTHLPTPQSPGNASPYLNGSAESPSFNSAASPHRPLGDSSIALAQRQMLTPDSSPVAARKWALHEGDTTPTKQRKTSPRTPPPPHPHPGPFKMESPGGSGALVASSSPNSPGPSTLSSPFIQKASTSPPPLRPSSPSPTRPPGARIKEDEASARAAQQRLMESRRPDYMRRISRVDAPSADMPGLGIAETPVKGRRIELWGFQETSEESFEELLMAGGYGGYGSTAPERATAPPAPSRALEWASTFTPGPRGSSSTSAQEDTVPDGPINEREARKRRRLEAFRRVPTRVKSSLHPVEVEGKGRVLLDVGAEEVSELLEELQSSAAGKKRGAKKRRRVGPGSRGGKMRTVKEETKPPSVREGAPLDWPDEEFPWNVRTHERRELEAAEEADRMRWIGKFLDEDSDAKSSEAAQDEDVPPIRLDHPDPPLSAQHEHGRMMPSPSRDGTSPQRILLPSDPADARAALLSKQSVRALAARRRLRVQSSADDDEEILCICRGRDDGRELVQCDDCRTWYHLECLGIRDIAELGREEDPWYCHNCVTLMSNLPVSEPTFAPVEEEIPPRRRRDPLFFEALQDSPAGSDWRIPLHGPGGPTTPKTNRTRAAAAAVEESSRSSFGSRNGPHTPRNSSASAERVRVYTTTPGADERIFHHHHHDSDDNISPFDPTSTPSRGMRVGASVGSVFATPKWQVRAPPPPPPLLPPTHAPHSPHHDRTVGSALPLLSSPYRASLTHHEDTPVDRSAPRPPFPSKRMQESPLTGRGAVVRGYPYPQGSPAPLGRKGKERQGTGRR